MSIFPLEHEAVPLRFLPFSAGCLSIRYNAETGIPIEWNKYLSLIDESIGSLPGVANIRVDARFQTWDCLDTKDYDRPLNDGGDSPRESWRVMPLREIGGLTKYALLTHPT